ncbi:aa3-type cytochrome c oxidase subunit IV [Aliiroseovarius sp.]
MAEHKIGTMDTKVQEKTYEGFVKFTTRSVIAILVFLVFLAIVGA